MVTSSYNNWADREKQLKDRSDNTLYILKTSKRWARFRLSITLSNRVLVRQLFNTCSGISFL